MLGGHESTTKLTILLKLARCAILSGSYMGAIHYWDNYRLCYRSVEKTLIYGMSGLH